MIRIDLDGGPAAAVWQTNTIGALYELAKRAPGETAALTIGNETILVLQDASAARHLLRDNVGNYDKNFGGFQGFFGESRITSNGSRWELLHKLSQPYINAAQPAQVVESATRNFSEAAGALLSSRDAAGGVTLDRQLNRAAASVVSEVALGFAALSVDDAMLDDFHDMLAYGASRNWSIGGSVQLDDLDQRQRYFAAQEHLRVTIHSAVAQATAGSEDRSLLRDLHDGQKDGVDIVGEICSLLFAGFDTSSSAIGWGLFLLAAAPDLQSMLRDKIAAALGNADPSANQLAEIPELLAFQNEVLRIFPPIPLLGRRANAPDAIGPLKVKAEQRVLISIIGLHHDRNYFPNPASIRLKRYPDGEVTRAHMGHLMPFGAGRRICGGSRLANLELTTAFAILIRALKVSLPDHRPVQFEWTASLRRKNGQYLLLQPVER